MINCQGIGIVYPRQARGLSLPVRLMARMWSGLLTDYLSKKDLGGKKGNKKKKQIEHDAEKYVSGKKK